MAGDEIRRPESVPADLPGPYAALLQFLGDLHEQAEQFEAGAAMPPDCREISAKLRETLAGLAAIVMLMGAKR